MNKIDECRRQLNIIEANIAGDGVESAHILNDLLDEIEVGLRSIAEEDDLVRQAPGFAIHALRRCQETARYLVGAALNA